MGRGARAPRGASAAAGFTGILDSLSPTHAWDIAHLLDSSYSGAAFSLREDGGDTDADINYLADGTVDESAVSTHTGANNGFFNDVKDQIGAADWTQAADANQPQWGSALFNSQPSSDLDGVSDHFVCNAIATAITGNDTPFTMLMAAQTDATGGTTSFWGAGNDNNTNPLFNFAEQSGPIYEASRRQGGGNPTVSGGTSDTSPHVHTWRYNGTTLDWWVDATQVATAASCDTAEFSPALNRCAIGGLHRTTVALFLNGKISGAIFFNSALADSPLSTLRSDYISLKGL